MSAVRSYARPLRMLALLVDVAASALAFSLARVTHVPGTMRATPDFQADAVFVPSGDPGERTSAGSAALLAGRGRFLVIAGSGVGGDSSAVLAAQALAEGVPREKIVLETQSTSTWENFAFSRPILASRGVKRLLVVTNRLHARRAVLAARTALPGVDVRVEPVDVERVGLASLARELGKTAVYAVQGEVPPWAPLGL